MHERESCRLEFELPNVGQGSETVQSAELVTDDASLLVVLLGSHYCSQSRELVRQLCENDGAFRERGVTVVPVLPDIRERARLWDRQYDLPFPMLADPGDDGENPEAFDVFAPLRDAVEGTPAFALCRRVDGQPAVVSTTTEASLEVPPLESLLEFVDDAPASDIETRAGNATLDG